jgi:phosphate transport system permease protein
MMKQLRKIIERIIEGLFTLSSGLASLVILLIIIFLFKEGMGLFHSPAVEKGYVLCVHSINPVEKLDTHQIKEIFDEEIVNWKEVGGKDEEIIPYWFSENELGDDDSLWGQKLDEIITENPGIIGFFPEKYLLSDSRNVKKLHSENVTVPNFFIGKEWIPTARPAPQFGVLPLILGTLWVSFFAILIALPLGLGVAIYLSELSGEQTRKILKPTIELLAGIPSVVYGFFGLVVLVPLIQKILDLPVGETALVGSLILAVMALPTIITIAEDAMRNTPKAMREASLGLGATHWQTIYRVIIPYASSGITAAVVLGIGRAVGETMAVLMVTGNSAVIPYSLTQSVRTIPATIAAELGEAPTGGPHYQALFMLGCILFIITMIISVFAEIINKKQQNKGI